MDDIDIEQSIIFYESLLLECTICPEKKECKKVDRIKRFLARFQAEEHWRTTVKDADDQR